MALFLYLQLPSHKFRYSVWHDLRQMTLQGTDLHAPRVREGNDAVRGSYIEDLTLQECSLLLTLFILFYNS